MASRSRWITLAVAASLAGTAGAALAQSNVNFGRITAVSPITESDARARAGGAIVGGTLGAAVGSGRSGSNRALGGVGGAFAGSQVGRLASQRQAFEYTILIGGTQTITVISDQAGKRIGDCVAVERGTHNNLRLVADANCAPSARPTQADQRQSDACVQAKDQLLAATTADAFDMAERRVRLLCGE